MVDILGWVGAAGLLAAFVLSSNGKLDNQGLSYHAINLVCALFLLVNAYYSQAYPFILVNTFWAITSVYAITKNLRARSKA
jgi:hypothetical protein